MTEKVGPEANGPAAGAVVGAASRRTERQALRRQILIGGVTTTGVILALANRPALAGGSGQGACSATVSMTASHQITKACGQPAECWQNEPGWDAWAPGAKCNNQPVSCTHSTTVCSIFPQLNGSPFQCSTSSNFGQLCGGSVSISVKCNGQWISLWTGSQQSNVCAAILNDCFYGDLYCQSPIVNTISSCLSTIQTCASENNKSGITTACENLDNQLTQLNCQGGTSCTAI